MSVTLADIAKRAGCSVNTVSHALNNRPDISEKTRKYIEEIAEEMGYFPNLYKSTVRSVRSRSVAVIVSDISNPYFAIMIKEMEERLHIYGYNTVIFDTDENAEREKSAVINAISKKVDGIIICPTQKNLSIIRLLKKHRIPYILFGRRFNDDSSYVVCNDFSGGYSAAKHLVKLNRTDILYISAGEHISGELSRRKGIETAFEDNKIPLANLTVRTVSSKDGAGSVADILKSEDGNFSAVICFSDMIALEVMYLLGESEKSVPDDISVVGFDDIASKYRFPTMLTSVSTAKTRMAHESVDTLMGLISEKITAPQQIILPSKLIVRQSSVPKD